MAIGLPVFPGLKSCSIKNDQLCTYTVIFARYLSSKPTPPSEGFLFLYCSVQQSYPGRYAAVYLNGDYGKPNLTTRAYTAGSITVNLAPSPSFPSAVITPPCRPAIFLQRARPKPVPSYSSFGCSLEKV